MNRKSSHSSSHGVVSEKIPTFSMTLMIQETEERKRLYSNMLEEDSNMKISRRMKKKKSHDEAASNNGSDDGWELMIAEKNLTLHRCDAKAGSVTVFDTYKMRSSVEGVSAKEVCHYFWDVQYRKDWEVSIDHDPVVLHKPDAMTVILYQSFKTLWPIQQRFTILWSRFVPLKYEPDKCLSRYCVINHSCNYPLEDHELQKSVEAMIYVFIDVIMICETRWKDPSIPNRHKNSAKREDVVTHIGYVSTVDPGGWAPVTVTRVAARKEYPHFVQRLMSCVTSKCASDPLDLS